MCRWSQRKWLWWTSPQGEKTALSTTFWILAVSDPGVSSQESGVTRLVILERCAIMKVLNYRWTAVFGLKNEVSMWGEFPLCDALALSEWSDRAFKNFSPFFWDGRLLNWQADAIDGAIDVFPNFLFSSFLGDSNQTLGCSFFGRLDMQRVTTKYLDQCAQNKMLAQFIGPFTETIYSIQLYIQGLLGRIGRSSHLVSVS